MEQPQRPTSLYDHQRMPSSDGGVHGMRSRPLNQQMGAVSTPALTGNDLVADVSDSWLD